MGAVSPAREKRGGHRRHLPSPRPYAISAYYLIATAEASSNLARYDGVKYGFRCRRRGPRSRNMYQETRSRGFGREVKRRIMLGTYVLSAGYYDAYYRKAQEARTLIKRDFDAAFKAVDCMITPVSPCLPFRLGEKMADPLQMYLVDVYTVSLNLAGLPAMSIQSGRWTDCRSASRSSGGRLTKRRSCAWAARAKGEGKRKPLPEKRIPGFDAGYVPFVAEDQHFSAG